MRQSGSTISCALPHCRRYADARLRFRHRSGGDKPETSRQGRGLGYARRLLGSACVAFERSPLPFFGPRPRRRLPQSPSLPFVAAVGSAAGRRGMAPHRESLRRRLPQYQAASFTADACDAGPHMYAPLNLSS
jgi:hypothetical protein